MGRCRTGSSISSTVSFALVNDIPGVVQIHYVSNTSGVERAAEDRGVDFPNSPFRVYMLRKPSGNLREIVPDRFRYSWGPREFKSYNDDRTIRIGASSLVGSLLLKR